MSEKILKVTDSLRLSEIRKEQQTKVDNLTYVKNRQIKPDEEYKVSLNIDTDVSEEINAKEAKRHSGRIRQAYRQISSRSGVYTKLDEALTLTRKKIAKAGEDVVRKSGATMLNTVSFGNYKRIKQAKEKKKECSSSRNQAGGQR